MENTPKGVKKNLTQFLCEPPNIEKAAEPVENVECDKDPILNFWDAHGPIFTICKTQGNPIKKYV